MSNTPKEQSNQKGQGNGANGGGPRETKKFKTPEGWSRFIISNEFFRAYDLGGFKGDSLLVFYQGNFFQWDESTGCYWEYSIDDLECIVASWLRDPSAMLPQGTGSVEYVYIEPHENVTRKLVKDIIFNIQTTRGISIAPGYDPPCWLGDTSDLPSESMMLSMENGLLAVDDLIDGKKDVDPLHSWTPRWFSLNFLPFAYKPEAKCPRWLKFLDEIMQGDGERIMLLQQWIGLLLTPNTSFHKFLMCSGEGSNGKSVMFHIIELLLGKRNVSHVPLESFGDRFALWNTMGKLANIVYEVGNLDRIAEGRVKEFVAGDRVYIDRKNKQAIDNKPTARLMLSCNNLPRFLDKSRGIWRRLLLVPFNRDLLPSEENRHLLDELVTELSGIFNWAISGLKLLRINGAFYDPEVSQKALGEYRLDCDPSREFLLDYYQADTAEGLGVRCDRMYQHYSEWCRSNGYQAVNSRNFGKSVRRIFPKASRKNRGPEDNRHYIYEGLTQK